jgi:transcriptional antiterminator
LPGLFWYAIGKQLCNQILFALFDPMKKMTVGQFAKKMGKSRFTIYKRIANKQMAGVKVTQFLGRIILEVDEDIGNGKG